MVDRRSGHSAAGSAVLRVSLICAALALPGAAQASSMADEDPWTIHFDLSFDQSKAAFQPLIDADKGPLMITEVEVNGHRLAAALDTGAEFTIIDSAVARQIGLSMGAPFETGALGGKIQVFRADINKLVAGGFTRTGGWVGVTDLSAFEQTSPQHFSMIIGADFLSQVALAVDRDSQSLAFLHSGTRPRSGFATAPLHVSQPGSHFSIPLSINGRRIEVRIDTGSDGDLTLVGSHWTELVPADAQTTDLVSIGAGGGLYLQTVARLHSASLAGLPIGDALADRADDHSATRTDGVVGMGVLSRFNLFLDAHAGVIAVSRPQKPPKPSEHTMVGIQGLTGDDGLQVVHVMAHSPAQEAGIKDGDRICTVDGERISAAWKGTPKGRWMLGPAGKTVSLGRCDGGTVQVTLRQFY
jgi:predicted aspartyl protease